MGSVPAAAEPRTELDDTGCITWSQALEDTSSCDDSVAARRTFPGASHIPRCHVFLPGGGSPGRARGRRVRTADVSKRPRPHMLDKPVLLTKEGLDKLQVELDELRTTRRSEIAE